MKTVVKLLPYLVLFLNSAIHAEVVTDGTVGVAGIVGKSQTLSGQMLIPQNLGTTAGGNLFHSFNIFNINSGESATFIGDPALKNVISRVTGGHPSTINGLLRSTIGQANFYFINPAGVIFDAKAQVDVPAAFYVSTANALHFADGNSFKVAKGLVSNLSIAEPTGFGFLNNQAGVIRIQGSKLEFKATNVASFSAANIAMNQTQLANASGQLQLYAVGNSPAEIGLTNFIASTLSGKLHIKNSFLNVSGDTVGGVFAQAGLLKLSDQAVIYAANFGQVDSGVNQGIHLSANSLRMYNSGLFTNTFAAGSAPDINLIAHQGSFRLNGGLIESSTAASGNTGNVSIHADNIKVNNGSIYSDTQKNSVGNAGNIFLSTTGSFSIRNGGTIGSATNGLGNAGNMTLNAASIKIDHAFISSSAFAASTGNAGTVNLTATGKLNVVNQGQIDSSAFSAGKGGTINLKAKNIVVDNGYISNLAYSGTGNAGAINLTADTGKISVLAGSNISSTTWSAGDAGVINLNAHNVVVDGGFVSSTAYQGSGKAGDITVTANKLAVLNHGQIDTSTQTGGNAGNITINAQDVNLDGGRVFNLVLAGATGHGGITQFNMPNGNMLLQNGADIDSSTFSSGNAGLIKVDAKNITLDNAGIYSSALDKSGNAGDIKITATNGDLTLRNDASIDSSSVSAGKAGSIDIKAKNILVDAAFISSVATEDAATPGNVSGQAGNILINADEMRIANHGKVTIQTTPVVSAEKLAALTPTALEINAKNLTLAAGGQISASTSGNVKAGAINLNIGNHLTIQDGAAINSATSGAGNAGNIDVKAADILIDGQGSTLSTQISTDARSTSTGDAGIVTVSSSNLNLINGGTISSSTHSRASGNAGTVTVNADNLVIDGKSSPQYTGIFSDSYGNLDANGVNQNQGNANKVSVTAKSLSLLDSGEISSSTWSHGKAGDVEVKVGRLLINGKNTGNSVWDTGLFAAAKPNSSGQSGNITVIADKAIQLINHGKISIQNDASVSTPAAIKAGAITVSAPDIDLKHSSITTAATGNVDAGNIGINFSHWLTMDPSFITTTANLGNGGTITVSGGELIYLQNSGFLTSVSGANGNGGNINVAAHTLIMDNGVIQANAVAGSGGDINLDLQALIPSQNRLLKGGLQVLWQPYITGFNVIQAASATGVSGNINLTSPQFDISGSISGLDSAALVLPIISHSLCQGSTIPASALVRGGQGGIPANESKFGFIPPAGILPDLEPNFNKIGFTH